MKHRMSFFVTLFCGAIIFSVTSCSEKINFADNCTPEYAHLIPIEPTDSNVHAVIDSVKGVEPNFNSHYVIAWIKSSGDTYLVIYNQSIQMMYRFPEKITDTALTFKYFPDTATMIVARLNKETFDFWELQSDGTTFKKQCPH